MVARPIQYFDEGGERYLACPHCNEPMMRGVGGWLCPWCGRDFPVGPVGAGTKYQDLRRRYRNGEQALALLFMARRRLEGCPSATGPQTERLQLGSIQVNSFPRSITWAHEVIGDLGPVWSELDHEDHILLDHWAQVVARYSDDQSVDRRLIAFESGRMDEAIQDLATYRLDLFRQAHQGPQPAHVQVVLVHGIKAHSLGRWGYCRACGRWYEAKRGPRGRLVMRERCHGARVRWGIVVEQDVVHGMIAGALKIWERKLRARRLL